MNRIERETIRARKQLEAYLLGAEKDITMEFARQTLKLQNELDALYRKFATTGGQIDFDELLKYNRMLKLESTIQGIVSTMYLNSDKIIRGHLRDSAMLSYTSTITTARGETKRALKSIQTSRDITKTVNERMAGLKWAERTRYGRNQTILGVEKVVKDGLGAGKTYTEMAQDLTKRLDGEVLKPIRIVRTESQRVENTAKMEAFTDLEKQGVQLKKRWLSSKDERTRHAHAKLDGVTIGLDEDFYSDLGGIGKGPGMMGTAQDDINCRCLLVMEFK